MTEREKMLSGELYDSSDNELNNYVCMHVN